MRRQTAIEVIEQEIVRLVAAKRDLERKIDALQAAKGEIIDPSS